MPAVKGRRQQRGEVRRAAILDAAVELMSSRGFRGTALAAIANAVGLTEAGVLHYFNSKDELLIAVLEERQRLDRPTIEGWASAGGLAAIRALPVLARTITERRALARLYLVLQCEHLDDDGPVYSWFARRSVAIRRLFRRVLVKGIERGELRDDIDVDMKAAEIVAFLDGIQLHWLLSPATIDLVAAYESYTGALLRDLVIGGEVASADGLSETQRA